MPRLKRAIGACVLAGTLLQGIAASAAIYYVATTGSDSNPGTEKQPWGTIAYAVATMVPGDTTYVKGGLYNEGLIRFRRSGTQSAPIKLLNYYDQAPIINCIDPKQFHRVILEHGSGSSNPMGWITIEGFEIRNCYNGIKFHNAHDFTLRKNWIHHNQAAGLLGNGIRVLIDRNIINTNGSTTSPNHGLYMSGPAFTITNNLIYNNYNYGIQLNGSPSSVYNSAKHAGPEFTGSANWIIANNTFAYGQNSAGIVVWGSTCNNARIENNIFYENAVNKSTDNPQGINFVSTTCTGISIRNNLAYASGSGGANFLGTGAKEGVHYTQSDNIVNTTSPGFVNAPATLPGSPNFALTERSPAIDKGLPLATTRTAFDGTTRPQGRDYDIGAYEYSTDRDSQAPKQVQNVQVR